MDNHGLSWPFSAGRDYKIVLPTTLKSTLNLFKPKAETALKSHKLPILDDTLKSTSQVKVIGQTSTS